MNTITNNPVHIRKDCRLCGGVDLVEILSFGETPLANAYLSPEEVTTGTEVFAPLVLTLCQSCKLVQLRDVVDPQILFSRYLYVSGTSPSFVKHFAEYAHVVAGRYALSERSLVVDIGSNDGTLLQEFKKGGVRILGVDPAENIAAEATKNGVPTIAAFLSIETAHDIVAQHGKASVITANNVFAHTDNVIGFVRAVKELLADDGVFIFEVQYLKDLVEHNLFDIIYHEHLCYYHITPLVPFFEREGLKIIDVERVPTHGGSIRVHVGWARGPHAKTDRVGKLLATETFLNEKGTYTAFAERIAANKRKLHTLLADMKSAGKRIVGYGAPAKATTFCYAFGIDRNTIEYIVDDAPLKQGLCMPGTHIPIKAPEMLYTDTPDCCLILAWNFADTIAKNHQRFVDTGGVFISPVPEPRILS